MGAFSYTVAYDLRSPLGVIDGYAELLKRKYGHQLDREGYGYIQQVQGATQRMAQLITDLLHLSRVSRAS